MTSSSLGSTLALTVPPWLEATYALYAAVSICRDGVIAGRRHSSTRDGNAGVEHGAEVVSQKSKKARHNLCLPAKLDYSADKAKPPFGGFSLSATTGLC